MKSAGTVGLASALLSIAWVGRAHALDTLETYEPGGLTRFEAAVGVEGMGPRGTERGLCTAFLFGVGITDWFSAHYIGSGRSSEHLTNGQTVHGFGVIATPIDSYHFDLDLLADVGFVGTERAFVSPGLELNIDAHPDQSSFGLFVQVGAHVMGRPPLPDGPLQPRRKLSVPFALGSYVALADVHRLLLLMDFLSIVDPRPEDRPLEVGALRAGYNVAVHEQIELQHEVLLDLPQDGEDVAVGIWFGIQATAR